MSEIVHHAFGDKRCFYCGYAVSSVHFGHNTACSHRSHSYLRPSGHSTVPVQSFWSCRLFADVRSFEGIDDE